MVNKFIPALLIGYLEDFRGIFNSPGYSYFKGFIWALMLIPGRKRVTDIANACFFMKKHVSSFERFLSEHKWSMRQVIASLVSLLLSQLADRLIVHGAFLLAEDTTFVGKASKKMLGVQNVTVSNVLYAWELLGRRPLRVVADAYFATVSFIKPLMGKGIAVILRLRKDAVGWDDPLEYSGRGRSRKRGGNSGS